MKSTLTVDWDIYQTQCAQVVEMVRHAKQVYYRDKLNGASPKDAFNTLKKLTTSQEVILPPHTDETALANEFARFFNEKIQTIRATLDALPTDAQQEPDPPDVAETLDLSPVSTNSLRKLISSTKSTSCRLDTIPTWLCKDERILTVILPRLTRVINDSLHCSEIPERFKHALVTPRLKKSGMDSTSLKSYRPVSNLHYFGKLLEKVVANQLTEHMQLHGLMDSYQSAYRRGHSTETALVNVKNDFDREVDRGQVVLLAMLDLSAAFDTIDHSILLERLRSHLGASPATLAWVRSYLSQRTQQVAIHEALSLKTDLTTGVPQGSVLGPLLFLVYILPLKQIISKHGISYHGNADDTQLYTTFNP